MSRRTCNECGEEPQDPKQEICDCGGAILPRVGQEAETVKCLLCLDQGRVQLAEGDAIKCPRGCSLREGHA